MELSGWGRYPKIFANISFPRTYAEVGNLVTNMPSGIARGLGRSYGDSSLAKEIIETTSFNYYREFDPIRGILVCDAGVTLWDISNTFVPRGWFLPVTPGTRFVTIGGAIASDVHGKNHHNAGTFCEYIYSLTILLGNGEIVIASPTNHSELFHATCGGMGLTGVILQASIQLSSIKSSNILQTTIKSPNLDAVLDGFEEFSGSTYSVAWIDCMANSQNLGRSLLMLGEHAEDQVFELSNKKPVSIMFNAPDLLLNSYLIKGFNNLYYHRASKTKTIDQISFEKYFYPLDQLISWNRLYGKNGFLQYQFVVPKSAGREALKKILQVIVESGEGSFLAVLKIFGKKNKNYLSFPEEGYTLALDFKISTKVFNLLNKLDQLVLGYGGKIYLAKDARMSEKIFKDSYPRWEEFNIIRDEYHAIKKFSSLQSKRIGLN